MILKLNKLRDNESGFTLIELLVVILIIGILAAIAIPLFLNQRKSAADSALQSDLKNAASQIQTWMVNHNGTDDFAIAVNNRVTSGVISGVNSNDLFPVAAQRWNETPGLPTIIVSSGTSLEIPFVPVNNTDWTRKYDQGEFCIKGANAASNYNGVLWQIPENFKGELFYDSRAGGVKTLQDLLDIQGGVKNTNTSCHGYVNRYIRLNP